jgi:hypothetical protein
MTWAEDGLDPIGDEQLAEWMRRAVDVAGPVELAGLLDEVESTLTRYVKFPDEHGPAAIALWVAVTYVQDAFDVAPYIYVTSPEKRSGKTRILEVCGELVKNPLRVSDASPAFVYRTMQGASLLFDEVDATFKGKSEEQAVLRSILNSGWRRGAGAGRIDKTPGGMVPVKFDAFGPKMMAGIGHHLPDTVSDRSVPVHIQRKTPTEKVSRLRFRKFPLEADPLRVSLEQWASSAVDVLREVEPDLPEELHDRAQDIWEPLLAVADLAGGEWPERARKAALALHGAVIEEDSHGVRLLSDIAAIFESRAVDRLGSSDLASALNDLEESPWGGWPMDPRKLARDLKPFGIRPKDIRTPDATGIKGYRREQFDESWARYLGGPYGVSATSATGATPQVAVTRAVADVADVAPKWEGRDVQADNDGDGCPDCGGTFGHMVTCARGTA